LPADCRVRIQQPIEYVHGPSLADIGSSHCDRLRYLGLCFIHSLIITAIDGLPLHRMIWA
jgi:hypothetical protein